MNDKPISSQQLAFLIFLLLPGSSLVFLTGSAAGQNAWLAALLAMGFGLLILYIILSLNIMYPEQRITHISISVLGKIPGTILNLFFFWSLFLIITSFLFDIVMLLEIIYPVMPRTILYTLLVLPSVFCLYRGLITLARLGEVVVWASIFFLIISIVLALPLFDLNNLKPVFESWKPLAAGTLYAADWPFAEVVIFGLFLPMVSNLKNHYPRIYIWYLLSGFIIVFLDIEMISILGMKLATLYQFPLFEVFRLSGFGDFQRVELFFFVIWFITGITTIIIYHQGLCFTVQDLFALNDYKALILPLGLCFIVFSLYMFPNTVVYRMLGFKYTPIYTLSINALYPAIIFITAKLRQKRLPQVNPVNADGSP